MANNENIGDYLHLPENCNARNVGMEEGAQSVEVINVYASKLQNEINKGNKLRADMEQIQNEASTAKETLSVINHITTSNLGVMGAVGGIKDAIEAAEKAKTKNVGIDIVQILADGAKIAEEGNIDSTIFILEGIAQDRDIKVLVKNNTNIFLLNKNKPENKYENIINSKL